MNTPVRMHAVRIPMPSGPERTRENDERRERFGDLIEARALRARLQAQASFDEARGGISGQRQCGKDDSESHGVAEKNARESACQHGGGETAPGLVISGQTTSIAQRHASVPEQGESFASG